MREPFGYVVTSAREGRSKWGYVLPCFKYISRILFLES